ncbi:WecB/TagA/CpsF family glycosyltransferase [Patescibacteria group bacterium]
MKRISLLDLPVDCLTFKETIQRVDQLLRTPGLKWGVTLNPEISIFAQFDSELKEVIQKSNLVTADGIALQWAASYLKDRSSCNWIATLFTGVKFYLSKKYRRKIIPERVTGVDLIRFLFALCAKRGYRVFLLGGKKGVAEELKEKLQDKYPKIQIVGATDGFEIDLDDGELEIEEKERENRVISEIKKTKPHLLLVAFGPPKQERWIYQNQNKLKDVKLAMGIGGTFDFLTGHAKRAPKIIQKIGIEYIWRLFTQPKRFKRMIATMPKFIRLIKKQKC